MKCDTCKHQNACTTPDGYIDVYCSVNHWYGLGPEESYVNDDHDPWEDCDDYHEREGQQMTDELHSALTHIKMSIPEECRHSLEVIERALKETR